MPFTPSGGYGSRPTLAFLPSGGFYTDPLAEERDRRRASRVAAVQGLTQASGHLNLFRAPQEAAARPSPRSAPACPGHAGRVGEEYEEQHPAAQENRNTVHTRARYDPETAYFSAK